MYVFANSFRPLLGADKYVVYFPPLLSTLSELSGRRRAVTATCTAVTATCTAVTLTKVWAELELGYDMFRGNVICSGVI